MSHAERFRVSPVLRARAVRTDNREVTRASACFCSLPCSLSLFPTTVPLPQPHGVQFMPTFNAHVAASLSRTRVNSGRKYTKKPAGSRGVFLGKGKQILRHPTAVGQNACSSEHLQELCSCAACGCTRQSARVAAVSGLFEDNHRKLMFPLALPHLIIDSYFMFLWFVSFGKSFP